MEVFRTISGPAELPYAGPDKKKTLKKINTKWINTRFRDPGILLDARVPW